MLAVILSLASGMNGCEMLVHRIELLYSLAHVKPTTLSWRVST